MRRTLLPVAALLALLATAGCTSTLSAPSGPGPSAATTPERASSSRSTGSDVLTTDDDVDQVAEDTAAITEELEELWLSNVPPGTAPQIALRFMQALQRRDDLAAARQLLSTWRISDAWELHRVMNDVRHHADLAGAGPCARALVFREGQVIVSCGRRRVMVQATADSITRGVSIFDRPMPFGEAPYRHPHTWAITTVEL